MADVVDPCTRAQDLVIFEAHGGSYVLQRSDLEGRSEFYDKTLRLCTADSEPPIFDMTDLEMEHGCTAMAISIDYLKSSRIDPDIKAVTNLRSTGGPLKKNQIFPLLKLYLFTQDIEDTKGQDDIMDALLALSKERLWGGETLLPDHIDISTVYAGTEEGSPLRKFIVDCHSWAGSVGEKKERTRPELLEELEAVLLKELTEDQNVERLFKSTTTLMTAFKRNGLAKDAQGALTIPHSYKCCDYHLHTQSQGCGNKKRKRPVEEID